MCFFFSSQCTIDLKNNKLLIGTTGSETPFLSEGDLPEHARLNRTANDEDRQLAEALSKSAQETGDCLLTIESWALIHNKDGLPMLEILLWR